MRPDGSGFILKRVLRRSVRERGRAGLGRQWLDALVWREQTAMGTLEAAVGRGVALDQLALKGLLAVRADDVEGGGHAGHGTTMDFLRVDQLQVR
jgi:hypothetical protein